MQTRKGATPITAPKNDPAWTIRAAHPRDPDGNLIGLIPELPKKHWTQEASDAGRRAKT